MLVFVFALRVAANQAVDGLLRRGSSSTNFRSKSRPRNPVAPVSSTALDIRWFLLVWYHRSGESGHRLHEQPAATGPGGDMVDGAANFPNGIGDGGGKADFMQQRQVRNFVTDEGRLAFGQAQFGRSSENLATLSRRPKVRMTDRKRLGANPTGQDVAFGQDGDVSSRLHKQPDADAIPNRKR